jgi:hypothetical protein
VPDIQSLGLSFFLGLNRYSVSMFCLFDKNMNNRSLMTIPLSVGYCLTLLFQPENGGSTFQLNVDGPVLKYNELHDKVVFFVIMNC